MLLRMLLGALSVSSGCNFLWIDINGVLNDSIVAVEEFLIFLRLMEILLVMCSAGISYTLKPLE